jgi:hypothetical protein
MSICLLAHPLAARIRKRFTKSCASTASAPASRKRKLATKAGIPDLCGRVGARRAEHRLGEHHPLSRSVGGPLGRSTKQSHTRGLSAARRQRKTSRKEQCLARADFSHTTADLIAARAGYQCSFPTCDRRTIGPGAGPRDTSSSGVAAHIYSASPNGPRGQGGLTHDELTKPENGIWLCAEHARLVDNNQGRRFSSETLLSYKALQEARVEREHQGLYSPIGWLHRLTIVESPLVGRGQTVYFAKMNLLYGQNGAGKTAIVEWLAGTFGGDLRRWRTPGAKLRIEVSYLTPQPLIIQMDVEEENSIHFRIDGNSVAFNPIQLRLVRPKWPDRNQHDDRLFIADSLGIEPVIVDNLVDEIHAFPHARIHNLRFVQEVHDDDDMETGNPIKPVTVLRLDVDGTVTGLPFSTLSGRERERVLIEFATAMARLSGRFAPTILLLDEFVGVIFEEWFDFYSHHFLDPSNQFQTFMCLPTRDLDLDRVSWLGWEVLRLSGVKPSVLLSQFPRDSHKSP